MHYEHSSATVSSLYMRGNVLAEEHNLKLVISFSAEMIPLQRRHTINVFTRSARNHPGRMEVDHGVIPNGLGWPNEIASMHQTWSTPTTTIGCCYKTTSTVVIPMLCLRPKGFANGRRIFEWKFCEREGIALRTKLRADSRLATSQWETSLQSNTVSYWLGANLESALKLIWFEYEDNFCPTGAETGIC